MYLLLSLTDFEKSNEVRAQLTVCHRVLTSNSEIIIAHVSNVCFTLFLSLCID